MPADFKRVKDIFLAAVERASPVERAACLQEACGNDLPLRQKVEALLRQHDAAGSFLESPVQAPAATSESSAADGAPSESVSTSAELREAVGSRIGPYKLLQQIGEGGMGAVFMAEQLEPVQRKVALKVIKPGMDSRQVIARFEVERQALALMDHPSIAQVFDGGATDSGRPYFVMELVKGISITKYCDEQRLPLRQRLELFVSVCQAVQHAHQKGIIHRDLKPSNVLIALYDGRALPKVIDFGVAKATGPKLTDKTLFTDFGAVVGTLEYMSPEQAEPNQLDVDTRSDVYTLGVLLYELLTGTTPLESKRLRQGALLEGLRIIREEEPPKPSMRLSTTEQLQVIAAKRGLEPNKLSGVVRGDLDWIVMKCLEKDRNRRYETANGLALDVQRYLADEPVQASPPSPLYRLRKFARRHKAGLLTTAAALSFAVLAASGVGWVAWDRTAQRGKEARRVADTQQAVTPTLAKAEQLSEQASGMPLESSKEAEAALVVWQQASDVLGQAEATLRAGVADDRLGQRVQNARARIGEGRARTEQRRTQAFRREKLFRDLDDARMAATILFDGKFDHGRVVAKYKAAFAEFGLEVQPGQTEILAEWIGAEEPAVREALIVALDHWALHESTPPLKASLWAIAQAADDNAWRTKWRQAVVERDGATLARLGEEARRLALPPTSLQLLAKALLENDRQADAIDLLRWARGPHPADFWIAANLGVYLEQAGVSDPQTLEERLGCFRVAVALRPDASNAHNNLGNALYAKKQLDDAIAEFKTAIKRDPKNAKAHNNLGNAFTDKRQLDDAIAECRQAIALEPKYASAHINLGRALAAKKQWDDAIAAYRQAIVLDFKLAKAHNNLGAVLLAKNQLDDAIAECNQAIALEPNFASAHFILGSALAARKQWDDAIAAFRQGLALEPQSAAGHCSLGEALAGKNQVDDAIAEFKKAIDFDPKLAMAYNDLGAALKTKKQLNEAIVEFKRAIDIDPKYALFHYNLGIALRDKSQLEEAITEYRTAIDLDHKLAIAHGALGHALLMKGCFAEAQTSLQRTVELLPTNHPARPGIVRQLQQCNDLLVLEAKLPDVLAGKTPPADSRESLGLIAVCRLQKRYAPAAKLYADAFGDTKFADDLKAAHRYNAACAAALAAAGKGMDTDKLDDQERTRLRKQALEWLRADLDLWGQLWNGGKAADRQLLKQRLPRWLEDSDLATVRDPGALKKLPAEEQESWGKLWIDVADLLHKAGDAK